MPWYSRADAWLTRKGIERDCTNKGLSPSQDNAACCSHQKWIDVFMDEA